MTADAQSTGWVRARVMKELAASEARWTEGMRTWLMAPPAEGGMGFNAARAEAAVATWRPQREPEEPERHGR